jgi:cytochrome P450
MVGDLWEERSNRGRYPPGETGFSIARTKRFAEDPRRLLVDCYQRFGSVFTVRILHAPTVFMIGPAANHYMTVSGASNFTIRESHFRDLVSVVGDGILTTDGEYHRRMRRVVLPALHHERVASYFDAMVEETERALDGLASGQIVDVHAWARGLVQRIGLRNLFGLDPDGERVRSSGLLEIFAHIYSVPVELMALRGPFTPWARLMRIVRKLDEVIYAEIAARRARGAESADVLGLLLDARDEDGEPLTDVQVRDQVMTLLLSGNETTASGLAFLIYELARHPDVAGRVAAELQDNLVGARPTVAQLAGGELTELEMAIDETLRMYPAVWIGPRRATEAFEFEGVTVPGGAYVDYCPLASHYLPDVFPEPECFKPERFSREAKAALPKGAYVPFGGGSRSCIGMRFAQLEIRTAATLLLNSFELGLPADFSLAVSPLPMLMPKGGVPVILSERAVRRDRAAVASG